jgi:hypothetical protein
MGHPPPSNRPPDSWWVNILVIIGQTLYAAFPIIVVCLFLYLATLWWQS